ncbi:phosphoenolpyruvate synthase [Thermocatellispora tengchongensis]
MADLAEVGADMLDEAGGKAVNLGVLLRAGLPVPPGFVVTTDAYREVASAAGLDALLAGGLDGPALAARARESLLAAPVPEPVLLALRERVRGPVAVRSSATAEDLPQASFAGQQDTFLNVAGPGAVADAVRRCWASLWSDRAVAYRAANGIDHGSVRLAVVVQEMVPAEVAGVMFTADPVTGRRRQAVIEAAPGLGEAVVSGAVNPDRFVVDMGIFVGDRGIGRVLERRTGDKALSVRPLPGGGVERVTGGAPAGACLDDDQVLALARLGARVETLYGAPQDIEWAIDGAGRIWLTQARPITTLHPVPEGQDGLRVYLCFSVAQGLYRPITPMGVSAFRVLASAAAAEAGFPPTDPLAGPPAFAEAGGRLFVDVTGVMRSRVGRVLWPRVLDFMEARSAVVLRGLLGDPRLSVVRRSRLPFLRRVARVAIRHRVPPRAIRYLIDPRVALRDAARVRARLDAHLAAGPPAGATAEARLDHVLRLLGTRAIPLAPAILPAPAAGFAMLALAAKLAGDRVTGDEVQTVLRGLPHNVTTEMDLALWHAAARIGAEPAAAEALLSRTPAELAALHRSGGLPPVVAAELAGFLADYGDRAVAEIDLGLPRWSEDPEHVLGVIANYLRLDDPARAPDVVFARGAEEAERMIEVIGGRIGGTRGRIARAALRRTRALAGLRELPKFLIVRVLAAARRQLAAVGEELAARGVLADPADVFFLTIPEARAAARGGRADLRGVVAARREDYRRELARRRVPRVLLSDGSDPEAAAPSPEGQDALTGTPASAGTVTGPARVVLDPVGAKLEPGEILICPSTDPGWTPLFLTAGGLVMEMGGANSHGAVVAREYGIPAVVGVAHATDSIATGSPVTVDGSSGVVRLNGG